MSQKGGANPQVGNANLLFLAIFTRKLFEIEKKLDQGCVLSTPPLDPPLHLGNGQQRENSKIKTCQSI